MHLAIARLDLVLAMGPCVDVVDEQDVDPVGAEPKQRLLERAHHAVIGIVEAPGLMWQAADEAARGRCRRRRPDSVAAGIITRPILVDITMLSRGTERSAVPIRCSARPLP